MMRTFAIPFSRTQVNRADTPKPINPLGGQVSIIAFFEKIGWRRSSRRGIGSRSRTSLRYNAVN